MGRRHRHTPRLGGSRPERRKAVFDRRQHGPLFRFAYGLVLLPLGWVLHSLSGGRIPVRTGER